MMGGICTVVKCFLLFGKFFDCQDSIDFFFRFLFPFVFLMTAGILIYAPQSKKKQRCLSISHIFVEIWRCVFFILSGNEICLYFVRKLCCCLRFWCTQFDNVAFTLPQNLAFIFRVPSTFILLLIICNMHKFFTYFYLFSYWTNVLCFV